MRKLLLTTLIGLCSSGAATACELAANTLISGHVMEPPTAPLSCSFLTSVDNTLRAIATMAQMDPQVFLDIGQIGSNAAYDTGDAGHTLAIFQEFVLYNEFGQATPRYVIENLAVISHEYGHALFAHVLHTRVPQYRSYFDHLLTLSQQRLAALNQIRQIQASRLSAAEKTTRSAALRSQITALSQQRSDFQRRRENITLFRSASPYHELYADTVAVFHANDPAAISNALYREGLHMQAENLVEARSFTPSTSFRLHRYNTTEEHAYFYKVRRFIGANLWPQNREETTVKLNQITSAIVADLQAQFTATTTAPLSSEERNDALIAKLQSPEN